MKSGVIAGAAMLLTLFLSACGAGSTAAEPVRDFVTVALPAQTTPGWWYPIWPTTDCGGTLFNNSYDDLFWVNPNDSINYAKSLVDRVTVSGDDTVFTLHLNPRWHWSNGQPVTAADVAFQWQVILASNNPAAPWHSCENGIGGVPSKWKSVVAQGPDTVVITTTTPVNPEWFIGNGISQLTPVPHRLWDKYPHNMMRELAYIKGVATNPLNPVFRVVDGPYVLVKAVNDQYWEYEWNPRFDGTPKPRIRYLYYDYETSPAAEFAQLRKGVMDIGYVPTSLLGAAKSLRGYVVRPEYGSFGFNYFVPNLSPAAPGIGSLFQQLYIRQALQLGIDQPAIVRDFYHGAAVPTISPVPRAPANVYYDQGLRNPYPFNPARGRAILEAHGWRLVNGVMTKDGKSLAFTFIYASGDTTQTDIAELVQHDWGLEGIRVTLKSEPFDQVVAQGPATASQWDMISWGGGWGYSPALFPSGGGLFKCGGGANFGSFCSMPMNQVVNSTYEPGTPRQVQQRLDAYQVFAAQDLPVLYVPEAASFLAVSDKVHGYYSTFNPFQVQDGQPNGWWLGP
jgi:peptide/nickel transport system substrate-binding protein